VFERQMIPVALGRLEEAIAGADREPELFEDALAQPETLRESHA
jgi:hypothetical protein